jgi:predicted Fe-Mo cluster-binding NifX family protein
MKVLVSAQGDHLDALVDPRFGRARWLLDVDTVTGGFVARDNSEKRHEDAGSGMQAAREALERGTEALITGNIGPAAFRALESAGAVVYLVGVCTVREAIDRLTAGGFTPATGESVAGHWA